MLTPTSKVTASGYSTFIFIHIEILSWTLPITDIHHVINVCYCPLNILIMSFDIDTCINGLSIINAEVKVSMRMDAYVLVSMKFFFTIS